MEVCGAGGRSRGGIAADAVKNGCPLDPISCYGLQNRNSMTSQYNHVAGKMCRGVMPPLPDSIKCKEPIGKDCMLRQNMQNSDDRNYLGAAGYNGSRMGYCGVPQAEDRTARLQNPATETIKSTSKQEQRFEPPTQPEPGSWDNSVYAQPGGYAIAKEDPMMNGNNLIPNTVPNRAMGMISPNMHQYTQPRMYPNYGMMGYSNMPPGYPNIVYPRMWMRTALHIGQALPIANFWRLPEAAKTKVPWYVGCDWLWSPMVVNGAIVSGSNPSTFDKISPDQNPPYWTDRDEYNRKLLAQ